MGKRAGGVKKDKTTVIEVERDAKKPRKKKNANPETEKKKNENNDEKDKEKKDPPLKFAAVTRDSFNALFGKPPVPLPSLEGAAVSAPVVAAKASSDSLEVICTAETQVASEEDLSTPPPVFAKPVETDLNCPDSLGASKGQPSSTSELFSEFTLKKICERLSCSDSEDERSKLLDRILNHEVDEDSFSVLLNECLAHPDLQAHIDKVKKDEGIPDDDWKFGDGEGDPPEDVAAFIRWLVQEKVFVEPRSLEG